jgi:hypothetical protein
LPLAAAAGMAPAPLSFASARAIPRSHNRREARAVSHEPGERLPLGVDGRLTRQLPRHRLYPPARHRLLPRACTTRRRRRYASAATRRAPAVSALPERLRQRSGVRLTVGASRAACNCPQWVNVGSLAAHPTTRPT